MPAVIVIVLDVLQVVVGRRRSAIALDVGLAERPLLGISHLEENLIDQASKQIEPNARAIRSANALVAGFFATKEHTPCR